MSLQTPKRYRRKVTLTCGPSLTEQNHLDETRVQSIMAKYKKTGVLTHVRENEGTYMDYTDAPGFLEAQNIIADAKSLFESVPSHIRSDMDNDPAKFLDFIQSPENREQILAYGLSDSHFAPVEEPAPPSRKGRSTDKTPPASTQAPSDA